MVGVAAAAAVPSALGRQSDLPGVPEHPELLTLSPLSQTNWIGEQVTHTATFTNNVPPGERVGVTITFTALQGPSEGRTFTATTDSTGSASFTYTIPAEGQVLTSLPNAGVDQIQATYVTPSGATIGSNWVGQGWSRAAIGLSVPGRPPALVETPGSTGFVGANSTQDLPPGTIVDISGRRGITIQNYLLRKMTFIGVPDFVPSRFILVNGLRKPGKPIRIRLTGGNFAKCTTTGRSPQVHYATGKKKRKPVRRLWGFGKGRYETTGNYASATVIGTFWLIADYCDGTLITVREGTVRVKDRVTGKTVVVRSGHGYFAKAPQAG
jgi:hypothetical protein